jgi:hypothetical protein
MEKQACLFTRCNLLQNVIKHCNETLPSFAPFLYQAWGFFGWWKLSDLTASQIFSCSYESCESVLQNKFKNNWSRKTSYVQFEESLLLPAAKDAAKVCVDKGRRKETVESISLSRGALKRRISEMTSNFMFYWPCISIHPCNENKLVALFILSLFRQSTSTCFGRICRPSSGGVLYIYI